MLWPRQLNISVKVHVHFRKNSIACFVEFTFLFPIFDFKCNEMEKLSLLGLSISLKKNPIVYVLTIKGFCAMTTISCCCNSSISSNTALYMYHVYLYFCVRVMFWSIYKHQNNWQQNATLILLIKMSNILQINTMYIRSVIWSDMHTGVSFFFRQSASRSGDTFSKLKHSLSRPG